MRTKQTLLAVAAIVLATTGCSELDPNNSPETTASAPRPATPETATDNYYTTNGPATDFDASCPETGFSYQGITDDKGRIGTACGVIDGSVIHQAKERGRQSFAPGSDPAGWGHNDRADIDMNHGKTYHGYFYNRSHLIADSLGGDPVYDNLITGTRTQNVGTDSKGGMAHSETLVRDYYKDPGHADCSTTYQVTPNYTGNEIIPRTNTVNVKSCDGSIDENITVYNIAKGYTIDYATGTHSKG